VIAHAITRSRWRFSSLERSRPRVSARAASATWSRAAALPRRREYGPPRPVRLGTTLRAIFDTAAREIADTSAISSSRAPARTARTIASSRVLRSSTSALSAARCFSDAAATVGSNCVAGLVADSGGLIARTLRRAAGTEPARMGLAGVPEEKGNTRQASARRRYAARHDRASAIPGDAPGGRARLSFGAGAGGKGRRPSVHSPSGYVWLANQEAKAPVRSAEDS
jgi:hypothetical protein